MPYPTASLSSVKSGLATDELFAALSKSCETYLSMWNNSYLDTEKTALETSFAPIRTLWLDRARGVGQEVTMRLPQGEKRGIFTGIDPFGRLELQTDRGLELIDAGDLFFPTAGTD